jgi:hypothetical protein
MRRQGPLPFITWSLLLLGTLSIAARADKHGVLGTLHWELVLAPLWCLAIVYIAGGAYIAAAALGGRYAYWYHYTHTILFWPRVTTACVKWCYGLAHRSLRQENSQCLTSAALVMKPESQVEWL